MYRFLIIIVPLFCLFGCSNGDSLDETNEFLESKINKLYTETKEEVVDYEYTEFVDVLNLLENNSKSFKRLIKEGAKVNENVIPGFIFSISENETVKGENLEKQLSYLNNLKFGDNVDVNLNSFLCFEYDYLISLKDYMHDRMFFKFNKLEAVVVAPSYVKKGYDYFSRIYIAGFNTKQKYTVILSDSSHNVINKELKFQEGVAIYTAKTRKTGENFIWGRVSVEHIKGHFLDFPFVSSYYVE